MNVSKVNETVSYFFIYLFQTTSSVDHTTPAVMRQSLFARMAQKNVGAFASTGKKNNDTQDLAGANASAKTAVSMNNSGANNGTLIGDSFRSPFKDATARGIMSGRGLLTF